MTVTELALQIATGKQPGDIITIKGCVYTHTFKVVSGGTTGNWFPGVAFQSVEFLSKAPNLPGSPAVTLNGAAY